MASIPINKIFNHFSFVIRNLEFLHKLVVSAKKKRPASAPLNRETKSCDDLFGVLFELQASILCNLVSVIYLQLNTPHCVQT